MAGDRTKPRDASDWRFLAALIVVRLAAAWIQAREWDWIVFECGAGTDRLALIRDWAARSTFLIRGSEFLPLGFWICGAVTSLAPRALLAVSTVFNLAASCAVLVLIHRITFALFRGVGAARAAAVLVLVHKPFLDTGVIGGTFDAPLHAAVLAGCLFWIRWELLRGKARDLALAAASFSLACGFRFEGWFFTAAFSALVLLGRKRLKERLLAAAGAWWFVAVWLIAVAAARGSALDFAEVQTQSAMIPDPWKNLAAYIELQLWNANRTMPILLLLLCWALLLPGARRPAVRRFLLFPGAFVAGFTAACFLVGSNPYGYHTWPGALLLFPFAGYALWHAAPTGQRGPSVAALCLMFAIPLKFSWYAHPSPMHPADVRLGRLVKRLVRDGSLGPEGRVLLELRRRDLGRDTRIWSSLAVRLFAPAGRVVFDRAPAYRGPPAAMAIITRKNPSAFERPNEDIRDLLRDRRVRLTVVHEPYAVERLEGFLKPAGGLDDYRFFIHPGDEHLFETLRPFRVIRTGRVARRAATRVSL